jgi:hypothetical protein
MNILVPGAGAAGLPVARVYAVCRASPADVIRKGGFRVRGLWDDYTVRSPCGGEAHHRDRDYIFMTAPSIETREDHPDGSREP